MDPPKIMNKSCTMSDLCTYILQRLSSINTFQKVSIQLTMTKQVIHLRKTIISWSPAEQKSPSLVLVQRVSVPSVLAQGGGSLYVSAHLSCPACHGPQLPLVHRSVIPSGFSEKYNSLEFGGFNNFIQKVFIPCISLSFYQLCAKPNKHFLAVQDSSIGDLVTHSVSQ